MAEGAPAPRAVHCLMGPTGAGKTALALWLAERLPLEIVSVDSALVYRGMDIGTAKPDPGALRRVPHHLINVCEPHEAYSVARFCADASAAIAGIEARGRLPLLVGGTGLYLRRLETGIADMPPVPEAVRTALTAEWQAQGSAALHASLATVDPVSAARIHPNDPQRIIRALSIWRVSGRAMSSFLLAQTAPPARHFHKWVLAPPDRTGLRQGLAARFEQMLERGLVNEVMALRARPGMSLECPAMRAVGYREVWAYLDGELSRAQMRERAIVSTGQYAKRQYTWFRAEPEAIWLDAAHEETRTQLIQTLLDSAQSGA